MKFSRMFPMAKKDVVIITRESFFLYMVAMPIIASLVLTAVLGSVGTARPTLAVYGEGELMSILEEELSLNVTIFSSEESLREAVLQGEYDGGLLVSPTPKLLISGKSLLNERVTIGAALENAFREVSGEEETILFETKEIGADVYPWKVRFVPFLVIIAAMVAGMIISASLIEEREKKTLNAVLVTPITSLEVITAKALFGLFLGLILGTIILVLNGALAGGFLLIMLFLVLGTTFTVAIGLMAGVMMDNITDLITRIKTFGVILYFPAVVIMFPQIPQWIGKFFPTYYFIDPIFSITQEGAGWSDVWWKAVILLACDVVVLVLAAKVLRERMLGKKIKV
ncbi:MAG: ABC transporter permease [Theionarchaea archaeon]|nr:ABC transporter permease [Theionarchaea archaeon]